jgi:hypothetical protein
MISRRTAIVFSLVLLAGLSLLAWYGTREGPVRAFSLGVPFNQPSAVLPAGRRACEGPIDGPARFGGVRAFARSAGAPATLDVVVRDVSDARVLARGHARVAVGFNSVTATLDRPIPAGRRVNVCVDSAGPGRIILGGSIPTSGSIHLRVAGQTVPREVSLVMLAPAGRTFFSLVPTILDRAALFRPGWVGAWIFWGLLAALLAATVALGLAVSRAASQEDTEWFRRP